MMKTMLTVVLFTLGTSAFGVDYKRDLTKKECPVIANKKTKIYHVEGQKKYKQMLKKNEDKKVDNRKCFKTAINAEKAGYVKAKG